MLAVAMRNIQDDLFAKNTVLQQDRENGRTLVIAVLLTSALFAGLESFLQKGFIANC